MIIEVNRIYCGDCAEVMATWPDNCIDLTVTSPPYDNLRDYEGYHFDFEAIAQQLYRITKQGGVVVWVVGDATINGSETGTSFRQALRFMEIGFNLYQTLYYHKGGGPPPKENKYESIIEYMFIFSRHRPKTINIIKDKPNRWAGSRNWGQKTVREKDGRLTTRKPVIVNKFGKRTTIWHYSTGKGYTSKDKMAYKHPAIFPEALARDHILSWSSPGDLVLDPMCGSGTTLKAAKELGRQWVGIDISEKYCQLSQRRIDGANIPLGLEIMPEQSQEREQAQLPLDNSGETW